MNGKERSIPQDFDPDTAPDLSGDGWPEKFAKSDCPPWQATGRQTESVNDYPSVAGRDRSLQGRRSWLADADRQGAPRVDRGT